MGPVYVVFVFSFALFIVRLWLQQQIKKKKETARHNKNKHDYSRSIFV
jgi:hypothetical protein